MSDKNIKKFFESLGWEPHFIDYKKGNLYEQGVEVFEKVYQKIKQVQKTYSKISNKTLEGKFSGIH